MATGERAALIARLVYYYRRGRACHPHMQKKRARRYDDLIAAVTLGTLCGIVSFGSLALLYTKMAPACVECTECVKKVDTRESLLPIARQQDPKLLQWYNSNSALFAFPTNKLAEVRMTGANTYMLDIGANVGIYAHGLLKTFPHTRVISFEPIPAYAQFIREHPKSVGLTVESLALGQQSSPTELTLLMDRRNLGWNTLHTSANVIECPDCMQTIGITSVAFDHYYYHMHPELAPLKCAFIKIDTEGYESNVLKGMHRFLTEKAQAGELPLMVIEVAWGPLKHPNWADEVQEFEWLFSIGYQQVDYRVASTSDVWFVPNGKV
jgi:FkbM family methyltransferase